MAKPVAIILLNWNTPDHTSNCIRSLEQHCNSSMFDLIIADNGSTDDSLNLLKATFPSYIYIDNKENLGFAEGNNRALNLSLEAGYRFSLLLNNDTFVTEDFLTPLVQHLESNPDTIAVQPAIYFLHQKDQLWNGGSYFNKWLGINYSNNNLDRQALSAPESVDWITGCCLLVKNDGLKKAGLLNAAFFVYFEDVELSFRLSAYGALDYYPATKIYHEAGASGKQKSKNKEGNISPIIHYYSSRNKIWLLRKYATLPCIPSIFLYHLLYFSLLLTYFTLRNRRQKAFFLWKGIKEGLFKSKGSIYS